VLPGFRLPGGPCDPRSSGRGPRDVARCGVGGAGRLVRVDRRQDGQGHGRRAVIGPAVGRDQRSRDTADSRGRRPPGRSARRDRGAAGARQARTSGSGGSSCCARAPCLPLVVPERARGALTSTTPADPGLPERLYRQCRWGATVCRPVGSRGAGERARSSRCGITGAGGSGPGADERSWHMLDGSPDARSPRPRSEDGGFVLSERATRIELASSVWKTEALPLSYARTVLIRAPCSTARPADPHEEVQRLHGRTERSGTNLRQTP
jgi:hypothetical protein